MKEARLQQLRVTPELARALKEYARQQRMTQAEAHRQILNNVLMKTRPDPVIPIVGTIDPEGNIKYFEQVAA